MQDKTIKLLYISAQMRALISINQAPAGETGKAAVTQPIAAGSTFFVTMLPLENAPGLAYLPYTRRVSIAARGSIDANDGLVELCTWPDNIIELTLHPLAVFQSAEGELVPDVLAPFEFYISGERHTAFIYNEASSSFAIEHASTSRLKFISPLPFRAARADISFIKFGDMPVIYATGKTEGGESYIYAATILPEFHTAICTVCDDFDISGSGITVVTGGDHRQTRTRYERSGSALKPLPGEYGWFTRETAPPQSAADVCADLVQAVGAGDAAAAMDCLTPSLADGLSFPDLKEFFGDFCRFAPPISPACGENSIALKYAAQDNVYTARVFCADVKETRGGLKIDNLREP